MVCRVYFSWQCNLPWQMASGRSHLLVNDSVRWPGHWHTTATTHLWIDGAKVAVMCVLGDVDVFIALIFPC